MRNDSALFTLTFSIVVGFVFEGYGVFCDDMVHVHNRSPLLYAWIIRLFSTSSIECSCLITIHDVIVNRVSKRNNRWQFTNFRCVDPSTKDIDTTENMHQDTKNKTRMQSMVQQSSSRLNATANIPSLRIGRSVSSSWEYLPLHQFRVLRRSLHRLTKENPCLLPKDRSFPRWIVRICQDTPTIPPFVGP